MYNGDQLEWMNERYIYIHVFLGKPNDDENAYALFRFSQFLVSVIPLNMMMWNFECKKLKLKNCKRIYMRHLSQWVRYTCISLNWEYCSITCNRIEHNISSAIFIHHISSAPFQVDSFVFSATFVIMAKTIKELCDLWSEMSYIALE